MRTHQSPTQTTCPAEHRVQAHGDGSHLRLLFLLIVLGVHLGVLFGAGCCPSPASATEPHRPSAVGCPGSATLASAAAPACSKARTATSPILKEGVKILQSFIGKDRARRAQRGGGGRGCLLAGSCA
jgi:hypothetical protein